MFSPPGSHESAGDKNVTTTSYSDVHYHDKVVYAAPAQTTSIIPHQTSATGQLYALSTKTASQENLASGGYDDVHNVKKDTGGVST